MTSLAPKFPHFADAAGNGANVVEPSEAYKLLGFSLGESPAHGNVNWLLQNMAEWMRYQLDVAPLLIGDLESVAFVGDDITSIAASAIALTANADPKGSPISYGVCGSRDLVKITEHGRTFTRTTNMVGSSAGDVISVIVATSGAYGTIHLFGNNGATPLRRSTADNFGSVAAWTSPAPAQIVKSALASITDYVIAVGGPMALRIPYDGASPVTATIPGTHSYNTVAQNPATGVIVAAGNITSTGNAAFARSIDDGLTFAAASWVSGDGTAHAIDKVACISRNVWIAVDFSSATMFRSTDDGASWTLVSLTSLGLSTITHLESNQANAFVMSVSNPSNEFVYVSTDGLTWIPCGGPFNPASVFGIHYVKELGGWVINTHDVLKLGKVVR